MQFTVLAAPGSDPGPAHPCVARVVSVASLAQAPLSAAGAETPYVVLLAAGARVLPGAFRALRAALEGNPGIAGGCAIVDGERRDGLQLRRDLASPLGFALIPVTAPAASGRDALPAAAEPDVVVPGIVAVARELLAAALPSSPLAAVIELCVRSREAGRPVIFVSGARCAIDSTSQAADGELSDLAALAAARPGLAACFARNASRTFPLTVLVHGRASCSDAALERLPSAARVRRVDDAAAALREELRVRGERRLLLVSAERLGRDDVDALFARLDEGAEVAATAPDAAAVAGDCVLLALERFPQHLTAEGGDLGAALGALLDSARAMGRAVRVPGAGVPLPAAPQPRRATVVFLTSSLPEIVHVTLDAAVRALRAGDELIAVRARAAHGAARVLAAYPHLPVVEDDGDPLLTAGANRALGAAEGGLVFLLADDVLVAPDALDALRAAFVRRPGLGAALPAVPGAGGDEGVVDLTYSDLPGMRTAAAERAALRARETAAVDVAVTPALAVTREALQAVGGLDPKLGPTARGIAALVARLRAAGYAVVRCEDALAHRFTAAQSGSPAAAADAGRPLPAFDRRAQARGFDPRDRVPFDAPAHATTVEPTHLVAIPVASVVELERAASSIAAAAAAFGAHNPLRIEVLLDGDVSPADAAARFRPLLASTLGGLEAGLAVRLARASDLAAWRRGLDPRLHAVVARGHDRRALAGMATVGRREIARLLEPLSA